MLRILILLVALSTGGAAAWLTLAAGAGEQPAIAVQVEPQITTEEVLVASTDLTQGQALDETNMRWQPWPAEAMNLGFISRSAQPDALTTLKGSMVRSRFMSGEPIRQERLVSADSGFLSAILPSGMRAVAIRISAENTAGGFVLPDDRVDVIQTVSQPGQGEGQVENLSRTILTNVRVLAIDQRADETNGEKTALGQTATLELTPQQAEAIYAAQASGLLSLALRSVEDSGGAPKMQEEPERMSRTVRIISAGRTRLVETRDIDPISESESPFVVAAGANAAIN